jgi:hypothetical protein
MLLGFGNAGEINTSTALPAAFAEQTIMGLARGYDFRIRSCENSSFDCSVCNISLFRISAAERADFEFLSIKIIAAGAYRTVNRQTIGDHKRPDLFFSESAQGRLNTQNTAHTGFRRIEDLIDELASLVCSGLFHINSARSRICCSVSCL